MCLEDWSVDYHKLENRLESFSKWRGILDPFELAIAGFYYTGEEDVCSCFYCGIEIFQWEPTDDVFVEHLIHSPNCNFALLLRKIKRILEQEIEMKSIFKDQEVDIKKKSEVVCKQNSDGLWAKWFSIISVSFMVSILSTFLQKFVNLWK